MNVKEQTNVHQMPFVKTPTDLTAVPVKRATGAVATYVLVSWTCIHTRTFKINIITSLYHIEILQMS